MRKNKEKRFESSTVTGAAMIRKSSMRPCRKDERNEENIGNRRSTTKAARLNDYSHRSIYFPRIGSITHPKIGPTPRSRIGIINEAVITECESADDEREEDDGEKDGGGEGGKMRRRVNP